MYIHFYIDTSEEIQKSELTFKIITYVVFLLFESDKKTLNPDGIHLQKAWKEKRV